MRQARQASRSKSLTVLYKGPFDFSQNNAAAQFALAMEAAIAASGHVPIVVGRDSVHESHSYSDPRGQDRRGLTLGRQFGIAGRIAQSFKESCSLRKQIKGADCVIVYNATTPTLVASILWCRIRRVTLLAHSTEWYADPPLTNGGVEAVLRRLDVRIRMHILHRAVDGLIVSSRLLRDYYRHKPSLVLPTLSSIDVSGGSTWSRRGTIPAIVYAGTPFDLRRTSIHREEMKDRLDKTLDLLVGVKEAGVSFYFDIYGLTKDEYITALPDQEPTVSALFPLVRFHGKVAPKEVLTAISEADFTILQRDPNRVTLAGFPTKLTESINVGTPIITDAIGDIRRYVVDGVTGYLLPREKEAATRRLTEILSQTPETRSAVKFDCLNYDELRTHKWAQPISDFIRSMVDSQRPVS